MAREIEAPIGDKIVDESGKATVTWIIFFTLLVTGDVGNKKWTPIVTNLTSVGSPTITGDYYTNNGFTDFWIRIVPGTSTTSTGGSTYIDLPFNVVYDNGGFTLLNGNTGVNYIDAASRRCFPAGWTTTTFPVTITGRVRS